MPPPLATVIEALVEELTYSPSTPLDKLALLERINAKLETQVNVKEVNKALYYMKDEGIVKNGVEMHGAMPTWLIGSAADPSAVAMPAAATPASAAASGVPAVAAVAAADSDEEENRPLANRINAPAAKPVAADVEDDEEDRPLGERLKRKRVRETGVVAEADDDDDDDHEQLKAVAVAIAHAVLAAGKAGDHETVLSALGIAVKYDSPYASQRKAYLGLARLIHPDKLGDAFPGAKSAFQYLVKAYEALTAPEIADPSAAGKGGRGSKKAAAAAPKLARSNENCFRTRVRCPKCSAVWGTADSGLQPYEYSFLMQGLKSYVCCGCLFSFGCMSAVHECPYCHVENGYHPDEYHSQKLCHNCDGVFGFKLYPTGPQIEARLRAEVLERQQQRAQQRSQHAAREAKASVAAAKGPALSEAQQAARQEHLFCLGLIDECPRCGCMHDSKGVAAGSGTAAPKRRKGGALGERSGACVVVDDDGAAEEEDEEAEQQPQRGGRGSAAAEKAVSRARRQHLRECTDRSAHARHYKQWLRCEKAKLDRVAKAAADDEVMNAAAWTRLGGTAETAWLLTDANVKKQCEQLGVVVQAEGVVMREAQLASLARKLREDGGGGGNAMLTDESAPANLHALSRAQLRDVCAAHGLVPPVHASTDELIALLEGRSEALMRLEGGGLDGGRAQLRHDGDDAHADEDEDEDGDDSAYVPEEEEEEEEEEADHGPDGDSAVASAVAEPKDDALLAPASEESSAGPSDQLQAEDDCAYKQRLKEEAAELKRAKKAAEASAGPSDQLQAEDERAYKQRLKEEAAELKRAKKAAEASAGPSEQLQAEDDRAYKQRLKEEAAELKLKRAKKAAQMAAH